MGRSFRDSLKVLEADIQHANSLAAGFRREYDGACLQMRISYCPAAHFFLFLVQFTDCSLAGALGLLRILIYKVYSDGTTTMSTHERKASIRDFYAVIFPSLMQLHEGINEVEDKKQKAICIERYRRRDEDQKMVISEIDDNIEEECGICMEINSKVVLPTCSHAMCIKCYRDWRSRSQSCPFCRDSLKRVNSGDLWIYTDSKDIVDMGTVRRENLRRFSMCAAASAAEIVEPLVFTLPASKAVRSSHSSSVHGALETVPESCRENACQLLQYTFPSERSE
ncbi:hypothetical protein GUJ93_ZPchr0007g6034 [Zizania palustris]|uniref:RING-type domain-containing protein n=1 Tax=Zizania palustris TaxID=103762 RepID=A0A8J5VP09_ZIZPA|nr:hypothetical protein GUJ93_ZPchr0007g6034 [Zizania palustris]